MVLVPVRAPAPVQETDPVQGQAGEEAAMEELAVRRGHLHLRHRLRYRRNRQSRHLRCPRCLFHRRREVAGSPQVLLE